MSMNMNTISIPRKKQTTLAIDKDTARKLSVKALEEELPLQWITYTLVQGYINNDPFVMAYLKNKAGGAA